MEGAVKWLSFLVNPHSKKKARGMISSLEYPKTELKPKIKEINFKIMCKKA